MIICDKPDQPLVQVLTFKHPSLRRVMSLLLFVVFNYHLPSLTTIILHYCSLLRITNHRHPPVSSNFIAFFQYDYSVFIYIWPSSFTNSWSLNDSSLPFAINKSPWWCEPWSFTMISHESMTKPFLILKHEPSTTTNRHPLANRPSFIHSHQQWSLIHHRSKNWPSMTISHISQSTSQLIMTTYNHHGHL